RRLNRLEVMLSVYSGRGEEYERKAKDLLFSIANSRKARDGGLAGLQDPAMMAMKKAQEKSMRAAIAINSELKDVAEAFNVIEKVQKTRADVIKRYTLIEGGAGFMSGLFGIARTLVRAADEYAKPDDERLSEFNESNKKSLELKLFSK